MVCSGFCAFWGKQERLTAEAVAVHGRIGLLDVASVLDKRACLGSISTISDTALMLVLCGVRDQALKYFEALGELSALCRREKEYSGYRNAKNPVVEGDYATARGAELSAWVLEQPDYSNRLRALLAAHESYVQTQGEALGPEAAGRTALLLAQADDWRTISEYPVRPYRGRDRRKRLWRAIHSNVLAVATAVERGRSWPAAWEEGFEGLFQSIRDHEQLPEDWSPYHPDLDSRDVIGVARLRAKWAYGVSDPWLTMMSIRYPGTPGKTARGPDGARP